MKQVLNLTMLVAVRLVSCTTTQQKNETSPRPEVPPEQRVPKQDPKTPVQFTNKTNATRTKGWEYAPYTSQAKAALNRFRLKQVKYFFLVAKHIANQQRFCFYEMGYTDDDAKAARDAINIDDNFMTALNALVIFHSEGYASIRKAEKNEWESNGQGYQECWVVTYRMPANAKNVRYLYEGLALYPLDEDLQWCTQE